MINLINLLTKKKGMSTIDSIKSVFFENVNDIQKKTIIKVLFINEKKFHQIHLPVN